MTQEDLAGSTMAAAEAQQGTMVPQVGAEMQAAGTPVRRRLGPQAL